MDLDDAILLLRDPRLGKRGMILAAKLEARELGPIVFVDGDEIWNTEKMTTDEEWIAFAQFLRDMVRRKGLSALTPVFFDPHVCDLPSTAGFVWRPLEDGPRQRFARHGQLGLSPV
jgi:hypothetical protein